LEEAMRKGIPQPLYTNDLLDAVKRHRSTTKEWFSTAKNYALFSNEAGLYDDILDFLNIKK
ncbi:MAG: cell division protein, partial [Bacteroidota bacterium]